MSWNISVAVIVVVETFWTKDGQICCQIQAKRMKMMEPSHDVTIEKSVKTHK